MIILLLLLITLFVSCLIIIPIFYTQTDNYYTRIETPSSAIHPVTKHSHLNASHWTEIGRRPYQEDRYTISQIGEMDDHTPISFYGMFDGHVGDKASQFCKDHLHIHLQNSSTFIDGDISTALVDTFIDIDKEFVDKGEPDGTTSCVCVIIGKDKIICANAGDSRAIVVKRDGSAVAMSIDHKPDLPSEKKRIIDLGGYISHHGVWRVNGNMAVSRSIGDVALKPYIIPTPDITGYTIDKDGNDNFLVIASDGLWDVMTNSYVSNFVRNETMGDVDDESLKHMGRKLCLEAERLGSGDNTSVIVVALRDSFYFADIL
jgi:protein phosphatase 1L